MDQGNTDPNNPNPTSPAPSTPGNFGIDTPQNPSVPQAPVADQSTTFSQPMASPQMDANNPSNFMVNNPLGDTPAVDTAQQPALAPDVAPPSAPFVPADSNQAGANWANPAPTTDVGTPLSNPAPVGDISGIGGSTQAPAEAAVNPVTPPAAPPGNPFETPAPTPFNPFSASTGSTSSEPSPSEAVPTDLSNLVNSPSEATNYVPQSETAAGSNIVQPESLIVPAQASGTADQAAPASNGGGGFPKIVFIIGGVILLGVIAASAYFILGIGKPTDQLPASVPAEIQATPTPTAVRTTPTPVTSTGSASFSNLPGKEATSPATTSTTGNGSAYDLLRKRTTTSTTSAGQ
jgi:hypothetical protein